MDRGAVAAGAQPIDADAAVEVAVRRTATDLRIFKLTLRQIQGGKKRSILVGYAPAKILVQTQWEAVRFDGVKDTAGTHSWRVFSAAEAPAARAIGLCGTITLTQQRTEEVGAPR